MKLLRIKKPVDFRLVESISAIQRCLAERDTPWFIIGAYAREILLTHVYMCRPGRMTQDADFAIAIDGWSKFNSIKSALAHNFGFSYDSRMLHRLIAPNGLMIDLIPFGKELESPKGTITWPPDMTFVMSVVGYQEALTHAISVELKNGLVVQVASIPSLVAIKSIAWLERQNQQAESKDASDLLMLLKTFERTPPENLDRIYDEHPDILEKVEYNIELASAWLLGHDIYNTLEDTSREVLLKLYNDDSQSEKLIQQMLQNGISQKSTFLDLRLILKWMRTGIQGTFAGSLKP
jgi:predicted nucleotidyltransferase